MGEASDQERTRLVKLFRTEVIQTAAVAVAMVEDLDCGSADLTTVQSVLAEVQAERYKQNGKWGAQHRDKFFWMSILGEEVGEAHEAALDIAFHDERGEDTTGTWVKVDQLPMRWWCEWQERFNASQCKEEIEGGSDRHPNCGFRLLLPDPRVG